MLRRHKADCLMKMRDLCKEHYAEELRRLQTLPGVKEASAVQAIAEMGVDMKAFATAAMLVGWVGLKPRNDESNGKFKSRRTTHGNKYLRQLLIECSWAASRTRGCFFNRFSYVQVNVRKKSKMKVQVAIARKMLVCMWNMLSKKEDYVEYLKEEEQEEGKA